MMNERQRTSLHSSLIIHHFLMSILERIRQRAAADPQHIVLPEGEDPRTVVAASIVARERLARLTVLGDEEKVRAAARDAGASLGGVAVLDHRPAPDFERVAALYHELRRAKGDRKSTRLNSSHDQISYAVFCLKKKNKHK